MPGTIGRGNGGERKKGWTGGVKDSVRGFRMSVVIVLVVVEVPSEVRSV